MDIAVIGVNHNKTPINIREKLSFTESKRIEVTEILLDKGIDEIVILSTCNRSEIYIASEDIKNSIEIVKETFLEYFEKEEFKNYLFVKEYDEAIRHIYYVCLGLDSIVIGEDQILGQMKDAMISAMELKSSKKFLNKLIRDSITFTKRFKTETNISDNPLSISYIGVKKLIKEVENIKEAIILLIGLGKMGMLALKHLEAEGIKNVIVCNRNYKKSLSIKKDFPFCLVGDYKKKEELIKEVDIIISATSSPHIIISEKNLRGRKEKLYLLDLALPRDIAPELADKEGVYLYNVDSLKSESEENLKIRKKIIDNSKEEIQKNIEDFNEWKLKTISDPVIKSLNDRCKEIKEDTLAYISRKVPLEARDKKIIDKMIASALKRLIREPILNLKDAKEEEKAKEYIDILNKLFELD